MAPLLMVIYLRVSTEEQARKGYSLPEQREACRAKALQLARAAGEAADPEIVEVVDDFGGDVAERPALEQLREFVRVRRPPWLICMDPDRFSRSLKLQLIVADDLEAQGTRLAFVQQEYDPADLMSRAFFQFRGLMSELDKAKILERTARGKRGKLKAGRRPNGAAPYGYRHQKQTDELIIYEPEALWVRRMFDWAAHGHLSCHAITRRLNQLGVTSKRGAGVWHRSVVAGLLSNTTYCGEMRCNRKDFRGLGAVRRLPRDKRQPLSARHRPPDQWVIVPVPAIVDHDTWRLAQANLARSARPGGLREKGLLSTLVRCGECGATMSYARQYLRCPHRYATPPCRNPHQRAALVEATVWEQLVAWLTDPALLEAHAPAPAAAERLQEERRALEQRLDAEYKVQALTVLRQARGELTESVASELLTRSARHVAEIRAALGAPAPGRMATVDRERVVRLLGSLGAPQRRQLVLMVVQAVTVDAAGAVTVAIREESI